MRQMTWQGETGRVSREDDSSTRNDGQEWGHPTDGELELLGLAFCLRCALQMANRSLWSAPDSEAHALN
jgi:hypothetical protein